MVNYEEQFEELKEKWQATAQRDIESVMEEYKKYEGLK